MSELFDKQVHVQKAFEEKLSGFTQAKNYVMKMKETKEKYNAFMKMFLMEIRCM